MDAYEAIHRRVSTRAFQQRAVPREVVERVLEAAVRAPNHKLTEPWRFVVITGPSRDRLAEARAGHRASKFDDPAGPEAAKAAERTRRETRETPAFVVVTCALSDDPVRREEDVASTWMAIQNLLTAATAEGLGTYVRTGSILRSSALAQLAPRGAGYQPLALISLGYSAEDLPPRRRTAATEKTVWLD